MKATRFLLLSILASCIVALLLAAACHANDIVYPVFDIRRSSEIYHDIYKLNKTSIKESEKVTNKKTLIKLAKSIINKSDDEAVFAYFVNPYFCGASGNCMLKIYLLNNDIKELEIDVVPYLGIDSNNKQQELGVVTNGIVDWHNLVINGVNYMYNNGKYEAQE